MVVNAPVCSTSCTRSAIWAMFTVPTIAYKKAIVVTNIMDENKLISTYFKDSLNCFFSPPKTIRLYEDIHITYKKTNTLNIYHIIIAPDSLYIINNKLHNYIIKVNHNIILSPTNTIRT